MRQVLAALGTLKLAILQENLARSPFIPAHCVSLPEDLLRSAEVVWLNGLLIRMSMDFV